MFDKSLLLNSNTIAGKDLPERLLHDAGVIYEKFLEHDGEFTTEHLSDVVYLVRSALDIPVYIPGNEAPVPLIEFCNLTFEEGIEAAYSHDDGKLGVRREILLKPGPLNDDEMAEIKLHPQFGPLVDAILQIERSEIARLSQISHQSKFHGGEPHSYPKYTLNDDGSYTYEFSFGTFTVTPVQDVFLAVLRIADSIAASTDPRRKGHKNAAPVHHALVNIRGNILDGWYSPDKGLIPLLLVAFIQMSLALPAIREDVHAREVGR